MREAWEKELYIRGERESDFDTIAEINRQAFGRDDEGNLVASIRKTKSYEFGFSLVAVKEDVILGHVLFSRGYITHRNRRFKCLVLGPVAVLPEHQRKGIGRALIEEGLERAKEVGFGAVVVVGDPVYYSKFGFISASTKKLRTTMKIADENFMIKEISRNALKGIIGTVMFPREFLALAEAEKKRGDLKNSVMVLSPKESLHRDNVVENAGNEITTDENSSDAIKTDSDSEQQLNISDKQAGGNILM